jgi:hypothetical protein
MLSGFLALLPDTFSSLFVIPIILNVRQYRGSGD